MVKEKMDNGLFGSLALGLTRVGHQMPCRSHQLLLIDLPQDPGAQNPNHPHHGSQPCAGKGECIAPWS